MPKNKTNSSNIQSLLAQVKIAANNHEAAYLEIQDNSEALRKGNMTATFAKDARKDLMNDLTAEHHPIIQELANNASTAKHPLMNRVGNNVVNEPASNKSHQARI